MVNEKKVRLMTQLALDEKRFYKDELDESGYFRSDYIRSNTLKVLLGYSISYLLIMDWLPCIMLIICLQM